MARKILDNLTSSMVYIGTLMISVLSFFTTYYGLAIFLPVPLALLGSLGLQTSMLGIAWKLMGIRQNRLAYGVVFAVAAAFSIFFSYANFNIALKDETRSMDARSGYVAQAMPILHEYGTLARRAASAGVYQQTRLADLVRLEQEKGWATIIDEGSQDPVVQQVIDGARRTVDSWREHNGTDYRQGSGKGIISNYLTSQADRFAEYNRAIEEYITRLDSLTLAASNSRPVQQQFESVQLAYQSLPLAQIKTLLGDATISPPVPPLASRYVEHASNGRQALMLVINDLRSPDALTLFALCFAAIIDLIVLCLALTGSQMVDQIDLAFHRAEAEIARRIKRTHMSDQKGFTETLAQNLLQLRQASSYGENVGRVQIEFEKAKKRIRLTRGPEDSTSVNRIIKPISRWSRMPARRIRPKAKQTPTIIRP